ncbi:MAG: hypothetical protein LBI29_02150 [Rickettsiales bacterium]|nr:hypothetical protein [Rickettsiales bacterium]
MLRFADGDVFRGIPYTNAEGIYIPKNGIAVKSTFRNVLLRKTKKLLIPVLTPENQPTDL